MTGAGLLQGCQVPHVSRPDRVPPTAAPLYGCRALRQRHAADILELQALPPGLRLRLVLADVVFFTVSKMLLRLNAVWFKYEWGKKIWRLNEFYFIYERTRHNPANDLELVISEHTIVKN